MIAPDRADVDALAEVLSRGRVLVVSGAGMSTDSGIPDYRGPTGVRRHAAPMTFERFVGSHEQRRRYWARSHLGWPTIAAARPNPAHHAVARLGAAGQLAGVVTQNVDGLHSTAGSQGVIDLHGRLDAVVCLQCCRRRPRLELGLRLETVNPGFRDAVAVDVGQRPDGDVVLDEGAIARFRVVDCRSCGGVLKPDVVFFGEHVPRDRFRRALDLVERSRTLMVLGSSLTVGSGYRFVTAATRRGVDVVIVNRGATRGDRHAMLKVDAGLADVLPPAVAAATGDRPVECQTVSAGPLAARVAAEVPLAGAAQPPQELAEWAVTPRRRPHRECRDRTADPDLRGGRPRRPHHP